MSRWNSRPFAGRSDVGAMVELARADMAARLPRLALMHPGDVTWQCWNRRDFENIRLWEQNGRLLGYVDFEPPVAMVTQLHPEEDPAGAVFAEMLAWGEQRARAQGGSKPLPIAYEMLGTGTISTLAMEDDPARIAALERHGYERVERFGFRFRRSLENIPQPTLPPGWRLRHTAEADIEERIDLHRDAWSVWGPSGATVEAYRSLREAPWYEPELDVVLEHQGRLVSYAIGWIDGASGVGIFEPVGTRPTFAGRGLARQVLYEGLRRMRARGMRVARIGTASVNANAERCYLGSGFKHVAKEWYWRKRISESVARLPNVTPPST